MNERDYIDRIRVSRPWPTSAAGRPTADQPGTLAEQLLAIGLYLDTPWRHRDPDHAWRLARALAIPHARRL